MRFIFLLFLPLGLFAQSSVEQAGQLMELGERDFFKAAYRSAITNYLNAAQTYRGTGHWEDYVRSTAKATECYLRLSELEKAADNLRRAEDAIVNGLKDRPSAAVAYGYEMMARLALEKGNPKGAEPLAEKALAMRQGLTGHEKSIDLLRSYTLMANVHLSLSQLLPAQTALAKAEQLIPLVGDENPLLVDLWQAYGTYSYENGDFERMRQYYEKSLALSQKVYGEAHDETADCYAAVSLYYKLVLGADDIELQFLIKAYDIREKLFGDQPSLSLADSYERIAELYFNLSDIDGALDYYQKAQEIYAAIYKTELHPNVASCYSFMARCYSRKGNSDSEYFNLEKAMNIQLATLPANSDFLANTYNDLSIYYGKQEDPAQQLLYAKKAYDIWAVTKGPQSNNASIGLANMAAAYAGLPGEEFREKELLEAALAIKVKLMGEYSRGTSRNYYQIGRYYKKNGDYTKALINFQHSLMANGRDFRREGIYENPTVSQAISLGQFVEVLRIKAQTTLLMYQNQSRKLEDLKFAYQTYKTCLEAIDTMRLDIKSPGSKQDILVNFFPVFDEAIGAAHQLFETTGDKTYLLEAFSIAERSKAFLLLQALRESETKGLGSVPENVIRRERELRSRQAFLAKKIFDAQKQKQDAQVGNLRDSLRKVGQSLDLFLKDLARQYPQYYNLKYKNEPVRVADLQASVVDGRSALLEYFWGDSCVYLFVVTRSDIQLFRVPNPYELDEQVEALRESMSNYANVTRRPQEAWSEFCALAWPVYKALVMPALQDKSIHRLIIVPDGKLNSVPFEAMLTDTVRDENLDFSELPYLIRDYSVSYSYSATLLHQNLMRKRLSVKTRYLAFAPSYRYAATNDTGAVTRPVAPSASPLPGAEKEVRVISKCFSGRSFFKEEASEANFKDCAPQYDIIHLAMHGYVNSNSYYSFLAFSSDLKDTVQDNALHAYELLGMNLKADLVVLSACETGRGAYQRGEGVLSVARSFMNAGSGSVVMSLWRVSDWSTWKIMEYFYEGLGEGFTKDEALRQAKLRWLQSSNKIQGHPFFWAAFVAVGSPEALVDPYQWWRAGGLALAILSAMLGLAWWQRRTAKSTAR